ncbi:MAG: SDR family oxidoreductase [Bacteroidota bacterium]
MSFKNKVVWITGASSGIGEALVYAFDNKGANIIISARRENELVRVKNNCENSNNIIVQPLDLENHDSIEDITQSVITKVGEIDILINNGGISQRSLAKDTSMDVDKKIMNVNYFGTIALTKAVLPDMLRNKTGHIVVISSVTGKIGVPLRSAYAASKHALHGFFDTLRAETHNENIYVSIICPGFIRTNVSLNALNADGKAQNIMDEATNQGMEPNVLAEKIIKTIEKKKEEVVFAGKESLGIYLKRFWPGLFSKMIKKAKVT